jgi:peptidoglycan/LPS O-acetylase OafA/YrhL
MLPLLAVGRISYGIYPWHMMVFHAREPHLSTAGLRGAHLTSLRNSHPGKWLCRRLVADRLGKGVFAWGGVCSNRWECLKSCVTGS